MTAPDIYGVSIQSEVFSTLNRATTLIMCMLITTTDANHSLLLSREHQSWFSHTAAAAHDDDVDAGDMLLLQMVKKTR